MAKVLIVNGVRWTLQIVQFSLGSSGFEVVRSAKIIRIQFTDDAEDFASRVAEGVVSATCLRVSEIAH